MIQAFWRTANRTSKEMRQTFWVCFVHFFGPSLFFGKVLQGRRPIPLRFWSVLYLDVYTHIQTDMFVWRNVVILDLVQILESRILLNGTRPMQIPSRINKLERRLPLNLRRCFVVPGEFIQKSLCIPLHRPISTYARPCRKL